MDPSPDVVLVVAGRVDGATAAELCRTLAALLDHGGATVVVCDARAAGVDLGLVGALARLQVTARRHGCVLRVRGAAELHGLVRLAGLSRVLFPDAGSDGERECGGESEQRE